MKGQWAALSGLVVGLMIGATGLRTSVAEGPAAAGNPQENRLLADLYMQMAAEYRACCLQTYRLAGERLTELLKAPAANGRPPAVVVDLDETVFDNGNFQTFLYRNRLTYDDRYWEVWERDFPNEVGLVPGARGFIDAAEAAGVTVIYLSNRVPKYKDSTVRALARNGLNVAGIADRLYLKDGSSDKTARRKVAEEQFRVLLTFGDNLRDFSEEFKVKPGQTTVAGRAAQVDAAADKWGKSWIILPNPSYGEWERLLHPNPIDDLRPTKMMAAP